MDSRPNHVETVCAIEVHNIADGVTQHMLQLFFENERKSGSSHFEDLKFDEGQRKAVITFTDPAGAVSLTSIHLFLVLTVYIYSKTRIL